MKMIGCVLKEKRINYFFDLITIKPEGALKPDYFTIKTVPMWENQTVYSKIYLGMLAKAFMFLSKDQGILVAQVPSWLLRTIRDFFCKNHIKNITVEFTNETSSGHSGIMIVREQHSPESLPIDA